MSIPAKKTVVCCLTMPFLLACILQATYQDQIGLYDLRNRDASLTGAGVVVGQIEAPFNVDNYQTDPANAGLSSSLFTYYDSTNTWSGGGAAYDSSRESGHANIVGSRFYGIPSGTQATDGVAPGVSAIQVFEAGHYYNNLVSAGTTTNAMVVNQSFVFSSQDTFIDSNYDDYAANYGVLFVNGINTNNSPATIPSPGSAYNGITVGAIDRAITPLADNRSKPDIVAPGSTLSSYTTPLVAGAAAILIQSALREDAGSGTAASASDIRTIKALILNSATKAKGWSNTTTQPLDRPNGAGVLEVNRAQLQLAAGQYPPTQDEVITEAGTAHLPPSGETGSVGSHSGWNLGSLTNTSSGKGINRKQYDVTDHYFFDLSSSDASAFYLNATLAWNRQNGRSSINNLNLFFYTADGTLVASSVSSVDNVEHIYQRHLVPGRYVLQVHKPYNDGQITNGETYALAFNFRAAPAPGAPGSASATALSSSEIDLSWTDTSDDETGYRVERRPIGGIYSIIASLSANATTYSDSALAAATTYEYRITAFNGEAESSATVSATTFSSPPAAPSAFTAIPLSDAEIRLDWTDNSGNEDGFRIERRLSGGSYAQIALVGANVVSFNDAGLAAGSSYDYRITALNAAGDSASVETSGTTYSVIEDWRLEFFGSTANSGEAADGFDADFDSLVNLIEFVTGSDPTVDSPAPVDSSLLGSDGQISFDWRIGTGYDFSIGFSTDLNAGFTYYDSATLDAGSSPDLEHVGTTAPVNELETRTYRVRDSVTAPQVFLRLQVN